MNSSSGSCALYLCPPKGSDYLENKIFNAKSAEEKRRYLAAVLKHRSGGRLSDDLIEKALMGISINKQHTISSFSSIQAFSKAVRRALDQAKTGKIWYCVYTAREIPDPEISVVMPREDSGSIKCKRSIIIYAPKRRKKKGAAKWAKASKNG